MESDDSPESREKCSERIINACLTGLDRHFHYLVFLRINLISSSPFMASIIIAKIVKRAMSGAKTEMECQGEDVLNVKRGTNAADRPVKRKPKKSPVPFFKYFRVLNLFPRKIESITSSRTNPNIMYCMVTL